MIGSIACSLAVFFAFQVLASGRRKRNPLAFARISAMTSSEIRRHEVDNLSQWRRWLLPALRLLGTRLKLRPERIDRMFLIQAGLDPTEWQGTELRALRITSAAVGAFAATLLSLLDAQAFLLLPLTAWVGYVLPLRYLKRRRRLRQEQVQRELPDFVGLLRTFMSAGLPLERSLHLVAAHAAGLPRLSEELRLALAGFGLGESIEQALAEMARRCGVDAKEERLEVEPALAGDHDLAVGDAPLGEAGEERTRQLGKIAIQRLELARLQVQLRSVAKHERTEAVPLRLEEPAVAVGQALGELGEHRLDGGRDRKRHRRAPL